MEIGAGEGCFQCRSVECLDSATTVLGTAVA